MEDQTPPPYVQHYPSDASVTFVHGESALLKTPPKRSWKTRCAAMGLLKVAVGVLLITTVASLGLFFVQRGQATPNAEYLKIADAPAEGVAPNRVQRETVPEAGESPKTALGSLLDKVQLGIISVPERRKGVAALPDVTNFTLVAADNHYITLAWVQPRKRIDFYLLDVTDGSGYENNSLRKQRAGSCSNDTFIRAEQTQVTCGPFDACSKLTATIRTYTTGPPERISKGTTLNELFINGEEPSEPKGITMVAKSPSITRLLWEPPTRIHGLVDVYTVKVCETFSECDQKQNLKDCVEHEVSDTWLDFDSTEDTPYCVKITASARCGGKVLTSLPAVQEVRTPLSSLPDVSNLRLISAKSGHITLSWQRPKGRFDYYSVEVTEDKVSSPDTAKHWLGLCANGTIIRPDQTELMCGPLEPCRNLSCTMRTHLSGPPERSSPGVTLKGIFIPVEDLPDATNLRLLSAVDNSITVAWERPQARFDYFWLSISDNKDEGRGNAQKGRVGSCGNGTIIHPNQTWATCPNLEACTKVSVTLRTHINGPPERTSRGVSLQDILIPGEDPDPPRNITMVAKSPSLTRLQWEPSAKAYGRLLAYTVKICDTFKSCSGEANMQGCIELQAHETWLDFQSSVDTKYCGLVTTSSQCGEQVLHSRAAVAEIRTPVPVLPDVTNLTLKAVDNHYVTVAWDPPRGTFDFYWLDVTNENDNEKDGVHKHHAGSCGNGTIIRSEQTQVTCGPFDPCSNISVTVGTSIKGPPARSSTGTTLKGVFLSAQDPSEPKNIIFVAKSPSMARLQWEPPTRIHGILDVYKVKVCKEYTVCDRKESPGGCIEKSASDDWLDFETTADTSYCVVITASARCGADVLTSLPATLEVRTPSFDPPDVTKLTLLSTGDNYITVAWERPKAPFDYYWVSVTDGRGEKHPNAGSCPIGTIIRRDQTQVTCRGLESCSNVTVSIGTHRNGPPERTSTGVSLQDIFVPGKDCQQNLCYQWVAWSGKTVPENAVPGGDDASGTLYICRAKHNGRFIPGKFTSWFLSQENPVKWVLVSDGSQPSGFIQVDSTSAGERLYIGFIVAS
ncbi:hypothetical protein HPB49_012491 [Dermacentor silvarum]|uniref:Uncharacterized protein n=1 Tax=Dermacentor silvarum TaxID=543639 RepID=A0ACB8C3P2_DERSI|nr:hypothetical protein HPB49_012491 [Dermacentor silvarum]